MERHFFIECTHQDSSQFRLILVSNLPGLGWKGITSWGSSTRTSFQFDFSVPRATILFNFRARVGCAKLQRDTYSGGFSVVGWLIIRDSRNIAVAPRYLLPNLTTLLAKAINGFYKFLTMKASTWKLAANKGFYFVVFS